MRSIIENASVLGPSKRFLVCRFHTKAMTNSIVIVLLQYCYSWCVWGTHSRESFFLGSILKKHYKTITPCNMNLYNRAHTKEIFIMDTTPKDYLLWLQQRRSIHYESHIEGTPWRCSTPTLKVRLQFYTRTASIVLQTLLQCYYSIINLLLQQYHTNTTKRLLQYYHTKTPDFMMWPEDEVI
jgi:hypothetical protein